MIAKPLIYAAARTHIGRVRQRNEDAVFADPKLGLVAVADGLGGRPTGDIASRLAIETLSHSLTSLSTPGDLSPPLALHRALNDTNAHVYAMSLRIPGCIGMGTTMVAGWFVSTRELGLQLIVAHVGDSRLYRYRSAPAPTLELLTRDHTGAQKHILTKAIGIDPEVDIDLMTTPVLPGDLVLLCSDGLSNMLDESSLLALLTNASTADDAALMSLARALIDAANERGGHDNIGVALATPSADPSTSSS